MGGVRVLQEEEGQAAGGQEGGVKDNKDTNIQ